VIRDAFAGSTIDIIAECTEVGTQPTPMRKGVAAVRTAPAATLDERMWRRPMSVMALLHDKGP